MNRWILVLITLTALNGTVVRGASPSDQETAAQYAEVRNHAEANLDNPANPVMPFSCREVKNKNPEALRHFIRGCNLIGIYDPHDNMNSFGLSKQQMLKGLDRAEAELKKALKTDSNFMEAQVWISHCRMTKKSGYFMPKRFE